MSLAPALAPLAAYPQFVVWRLEARPGSTKPTKVPYSPIHGGKASSTNPADWGNYEQALACQARTHADGIGFVFTERDPFFFLDIDGALQAGAWSMTAQELCARLGGAAVEVSQSGTGLHIIGSTSGPFDHRNKNTPLGLELYTKERFVALTGTHASGSVSAVMDAQLASVVSQFFTRDPGGVATEWTTEPRAGWAGPADDLELLDRIYRSDDRKQSAGAAFAGTTDIKFVDLFTANADVLGVKWPDPQQGRGFDYTNAEQSMANQLAFWTGGNCERIERIMRLSALCRSKWDTHHTYLQNTILRAVGLVTNNYVERGTAVPAPAPPPAEVNSSGEPVGRGGFLRRDGQLRHFAGCVYVVALNKILLPGGEIVDQGRFNVVRGGFEFVLSPDGRKTVTSAWTAFTESQTDEPPTADRICFRPELGAGGIVVDGGKRLANAYFPADTAETEGDPSPFINHIHKMLPEGRDAEILLTYMASVKQNPGMKAQWWPVVQGAEGNFKSYLLTIMEYAVGSHYAHLPNMKKMVEGTSNFNGWIERKLFLGLDEVYASNRREFFEGFKTTVTNRKLPIEGKGVEEVTGDNRANGMIVTNHKDGVPISGGSRRYAPFFAAQQTPADMLRDGMDATYIRNLDNWFKGVGAWEANGADYGLRVVNHWLARKPLAADIDPNQLCIRAPETTATASALVAGRGRIEQEVQEAIEEGRQGFSGDWVSGIYLDRLLKDTRHSLAFSKRREMMQSLGYDHHPALPDGRVNVPVAPDGGKPRLYVRLGSISHLNLTDPASVARAYSEAQLKTQGDRSAAGVAFNK